MAKPWSFHAKLLFQNNFYAICYIESNIAAPVLLNLLNLLRKSDKMISKPRIWSVFPLDSLNKLNNTWALMYSCKILYAFLASVKPVLSGHSKIDKTKILMANDSLMKVASIAECSPWTFDLH